MSPYAWGPVCILQETHYDMFNVIQCNFIKTSDSDTVLKSVSV